MSASEIIIVDWGTTAFRAWLVNRADGAVLDSIPEGIGMRDLPPRPFADYCAERLAPWRARAPRPPVYLSGMVGAPTGWAFAEQPPLPLTLTELAHLAIPAPGMEDAWILPGARVDREAPDRVDVMRGEEVQIVGALALADMTSGVLCLPGTHSKWARVVDGILTDFTTFMTGEIHAALLGHTLLGQGVDPKAAPDDEAFAEGLREATTRPGGLLSHAFSARTRRLYRDLSPEAVPSFLSGVVIGEEVASAMELGYLKGKEVILVGSERLLAPYRAALTDRVSALHAFPSAEATRAGVLAALGTLTPRG